MYWEFRLFDDNLFSSKKSDESDGGVKYLAHPAIGEFTPVAW